MDKCSIFLTTLHTFSCCSSCFWKMLDGDEGGKKKKKKQHKKVFGFCAFMQTMRKINGCGMLACFFFVIFKDMALGIHIDRASCLIRCLNIPLKAES